MNFLFIALISAVLVVGVINTEPKDSEGNKETQVIVKESSETKPAHEEVKEEVKPEAQVAAESQAAAEAQAAAEEAQAAAEAQAATEDSGINYLRLALYIFGLILVISTGTYFYLRRRDNSSSRSATRAPDSPRRDFRKEVVAEPQEEQPAVEEVKSEPQEEQPAEDENKDLKTEEESNEDEKK
jgi:hypothetical protein